MTLLRNRLRLVPWLVGLFVVAQFAGVVPRVAHAPPASASVAHAGHSHDHAARGQAHDHADHDLAQRSHDADPDALADQCCALHLLTAVVPLVAIALPVAHSPRPPVDVSANPVAGIDAGALFRPPRTQIGRAHV